MDEAQARARLPLAYLADETATVERLIGLARFTPEDASAIEAIARDLVMRVRAQRKAGGIDAFLQEYSLSSEEGVVLMCLAEALLRVPDKATADRLIKDKIGSANWERHLGKSESWFVNASTWGLMLTGKVVRLDRPDANVLGRLVARSGEPVIRQAINYAMKIMGDEFVLGRTIAEALERGGQWSKRGFRFSYDMLGEAAYTKADAERYAASYASALHAIAKDAGPLKPGRSIHERPGISVKLSALHPRYEFNNKQRVMAELLPVMRQLCAEAKRAGLAVTIDAEEADRLELQLDVFAALADLPELAGWDGLGLAVQAYQKRGLPALNWLAEFAKTRRRRLPVRLVKGAYWDTEIKRAQEQGLSGYPVFTRKQATDVSYIACVRKLLAEREAFYPQFATHNAHTVAAVRVLARGRTDYEFQRLHGMGAPLYDEIAARNEGAATCRIYAPVGGHEDLLAYLVRRLLENGANTSFVNRIADDGAPVSSIIADPVEALAKISPKPHPRILLPRDLYLPRKNSAGIILSEPAFAEPLLAAMEKALAQQYCAAPIVGGREILHEAQPVLDPSDTRRQVGELHKGTEEDCRRAVEIAHGAAEAWDLRGGEERAKILERAADLFEENAPLLIALCVREAGKTVANGQGDVREAVDYLRFYAAEARRHFAEPHLLPGPTGERNTHSLHGRGVFACISPWNFPVAIFTGQVAAALAAGNAVIAKPAEPTPLTAMTAVRLMHQAGVPVEVLNFLPGKGSVLGRVLMADPRVVGVTLTGSTGTARTINRALAARDAGPIPTFIAETGGQNGMIVDSTALPEQVVRDVMSSAFDSAGQRCSALRVLFVQDDVADRVIELIAGALDELTVGDPIKLSTDIGPVIDKGAWTMLTEHAASMMAGRGRFIAKAKRLEDTEHGYFVAPHIFEIDSIGRLIGEVFGPMLHVVRYQAAHLDKVCAAINSTGFGLTLSIHSRIEETARFVVDRVRVGNVYVNRNQIGAVVGVQPFGGEGLSGTGPKAGGPHYLPRFAVERVLSVNTTASGGNAALLTQAGDG